MRQLGWPTLLCHHLEIDKNGNIVDYRLRQEDQKRKAVQAFQSLNLRVIAAGDSYNDITMLSQAEAGAAYGMSGMQVFFRILVPQMIRFAIPGFTNRVLGKIVFALRSRVSNCVQRAGGVIH